MALTLRLFQVDAFTLGSAPFTGNPAAVCLLDGPAPEAWMQRVAEEMNLSETAFVHPEETGTFRLRWFTPATEVDLCGHATLATAHILWQEQRIAADAAARFQTRSGLLTASRSDRGIELDFPAQPATTVSPPPGLEAALGVAPRSAARSREDLLVELSSADAVRTLRPDIRALAEVDARGVIVTSRGDGGGYDFVSRFFGPAVGIDEDPVTGSAHCTLAPWWAERLGRSELVGHQASRRGGVVEVAVRGDRVTLRGTAVTVLRGDLLASPPH